MRKQAESCQKENAWVSMRTGQREFVNMRIKGKGFK